MFKAKSSAQQVKMRFILAAENARLARKIIDIVVGQPRNSRQFLYIKAVKVWVNRYQYSIP